MWKSSFKMFRALKLGQNTLQRHLNREDVEAVGSSLTNGKRLLGALTYRPSREYSYTRTTSITEKKFTLEQFLKERFVQNSIYGVHYSKSDLCVILRIMSDILEQLEARHDIQDYHGNIHTNTIYVSFSDGRWKGHLSNPTKVTKASEASDMHAIGVVLDFVYSTIQKLPSNSKRRTTVELLDLIMKLKVERRLTARQARLHPAFWDFREKILFLRDFVENVDLSCFDSSNMTYKPLDSIRLGIQQRVNASNWQTVIDKNLQHAMGGKSRGQDVMTLLIWIRNLSAHHRNKAHLPIFQVLLPHGTREELGEYIFSCFPNLLMELYNYVNIFHFQEKWFESYYY